MYDSPSISKRFLEQMEERFSAAEPQSESESNQRPQPIGSTNPFMAQRKAQKMSKQKNLQIELNK